MLRRAVLAVVLFPTFSALASRPAAAPAVRPAVSALASFLLGISLWWSVPVLAESTEQREIDPAKSSAQFGIQHIFVDRVTGTVPILNGSVNIPVGSSIPVSATAVLDATRIRSGDPDRDDSLQSPDYFDSKQFPTWTFASTKVVPMGPAACGMDGTLTIHGVTQPEHLDVTIRGDAAHPVYRAVGRIDRHASV